MKMQVVALGAALLLAGSAHAAQQPPEVQRFLDAAHDRAQARLEAAGVAVGSGGLAIRAHVDGLGQLTGVRVVRSSGSLDTDARAKAALHNLSTPMAPATLSGRDITLSFAADPIVQATAH